jgi:hypothetical protein
VGVIRGFKFPRVGAALRVLAGMIAVWIKDNVLRWSQTKKSLSKRRRPSNVKGGNQMKREAIWMAALVGFAILFSASFGWR